MSNPEFYRLKEIVLQAIKGGPGSGNFGHAGRPGEVGGSNTLRSGKVPQYWLDIDLKKGQTFTYHGLDHSYIATLKVVKPDPYKRSPTVKIIKLNPNPKDMIIASILLDREHGGEIQLVDRDVYYTSFNPENKMVIND